MFKVLIRATTVALLSGVVACARELPTETDPEISTVPAAWSPFRSAAFVADISTTRRRVAISAPTSALPSNSVAAMWGGQASASLLGADAVEMMASNYSAGVVGAVVPGKILVTFDLTLINRLRDIRLITPTFPLPPANVTGIQAFPLEVVTLSTAGGVTATGGVISVNAPRSGTAVPSTDWDGAPHSFFNDVGCGGVNSDCFRWEPFGVLQPQQASAPRRVGFLIDPTVGDLRVRIIVAADLQSTTR